MNLNLTRCRVLWATENGEAVTYQPSVWIERKSDA